jgi:hypothetical protein
MFARTLIASLLATPLATASVTMTVDLLGPEDGISLPPPWLVIVDVLVDVTDGDTWTAGGLRGVTMNGATLFYARDPNNHNLPILPDPGVDRRFVTFISKPRGRDAPSRYNNGAAAVAGRYCPTGPTAITDDTEINVAYFASPPETSGSPTADGAVFRVALQVPNGRENFVGVFSLDQIPPGRPIYFISQCDSGEAGTVEATYDVPQLTGFGWAVVDVPEAAGVALLAVCGGWLALRRRR